MTAFERKRIYDGSNCLSAPSGGLFLIYSGQRSIWAIIRDNRDTAWRILDVSDGKFRVSPVYMSEPGYPPKKGSALRVDSLYYIGDIAGEVAPHMRYIPLSSKGSAEDRASARLADSLAGLCVDGMPGVTIEPGKVTDISSLWSPVYICEGGEMLCAARAKTVTLRKPSLTVDDLRGFRIGDDGKRALMDRGIWPTA